MDLPEYHTQFLNEAGEIPPPWVLFPTYTRYTIGWRMGTGETYMGCWYKWRNQAFETTSELARYLCRYSPAPYTWATTIGHILQPGFDDSDDFNEDLFIENMLNLGLIREDIAYQNWLASGDDTPVWANGAAPGEICRYSGRELTYWTRRLITSRDAGALDALLARLDAPGLVWAEFMTCLTSGKLPHELPENGYDRLALELAAGTPRPPWSVEEIDPPEDVDYDYETAGYRDAWLVWLSDAFDDRPSIDAYLSAYPSAPPAWSTCIDEMGLVY